MQKTKIKRQIGLYLDADLVEYLDRIREETERSRNAVIRSIIKAHREAHIKTEHLSPTASVL